jgi:hypothetical protein
MLVAEQSWASAVGDDTARSGQGGGGKRLGFCRLEPTVLKRLSK